uniref:Uncharacterized protein n=1 Tax=Rhizophora mucronata TaxID=61149 RepID=A0A2P2LUJ5_RHIMU
MTAGKLRTFF